VSFAYNPHLLSYDALLATFVGREELVGQIAGELRDSDSPQHHLIVGPRGIGKTTLLRRIAAEIERDAALSARWMPLTFPEEQYNVATLSDLWLNCLDALTDAADRVGDNARVAGLEAFVQGLEGSEERRAALALDRLREEAAGGRGLVLLIDNLQQVLQRLQKHQWALRQVLSDTPGLVVVAACPAAVGTGYGEAFYDFFLAHPLRSFGDDQLATLLLRLADQEDQRAVAQAVSAHPGRLRAMRVLTGGSPQIAALLFTVLVSQPQASFAALAMGLLDLLTPRYAAAMAALAEQTQQVLAALGAALHPTLAAELAHACRLPVGVISTQLSRLAEGGTVAKVDRPGEVRQAYQCADRLFNAWLLARGSPPARQRLHHLLAALEVHYEGHPPLALAEPAASYRTRNEAEDPATLAQAAWEARDPNALQAWAPELAIPAREILDRIWPPEARPPPAPRRGAKPRRA